MSKRAAELLLDDIREAIDKIERYTRDLSFEGFMADEKTQDGVVRNLEIIGEAQIICPRSSKRNSLTSSGRKSSGCDTASCRTTSGSI